jgi:hypothetical protein
VIDGVRWYYTAEDFGVTQGKTLGDYWVGADGTSKYIYLGSGLSNVPELPGGIVPVIGLAGALARMFRKGAQRA